MPVKIDLIEDGYVIFYEIADPFEIEDLLTAYQQESEYRNATTHTMHSLTDFTQMRRIPKNWLQARHGPGLKHPRSGEMIFVGVKPGLKVLLDVILKVTKYQRIKLFNTMEQAQPYVKALVQKTKEAEGDLSVELVAK